MSGFKPKYSSSKACLITPFAKTPSLIWEEIYKWHFLKTKIWRVWIWTSHFSAVEGSLFSHALLLVPLNLTFEFPAHLLQWNFPVSPVRINDITFFLAQNTTEMSRTLVEMTKREEKRNNRGDDENKGNVGINENDDLRYCRQYWFSAAQMSAYVMSMTNSIFYK